VKAAAVEALGEIGEASAEPVLAELAEQGPILLRGKAEEALKRVRAIRSLPTDGDEA
jgi:HEAT repeat protein